jgi:hypothetical protein
VAFALALCRCFPRFRSGRVTQILYTSSDPKYEGSGCHEPGGDY